MIPGPITTEVGMRPPGDPMFDEFWQLANDSGITVCYHSGETYYSKFMPAWGEPDYMMSFQALLGFRTFSGDAIQDTFANHLHNGLFLRFPKPADGLYRKRIGVGVPPVREADQVLRPDPVHLPEDPRETFKRHVWVSPFYEDELASLLKLIGVEHILMGSDYPHVEAWPNPPPTSGPGKLRLHAEQCRKVMRDNGLELSVRRPV